MNKKILIGSILLVFIFLMTSIVSAMNQSNAVDENKINVQKTEKLVEKILPYTISAFRCRGMIEYPAIRFGVGVFDKICLKVVWVANKDFGVTSNVCVTINGEDITHNHIGTATLFVGKGCNHVNFVGRDNCLFDLSGRAYRVEIS